jgi:hypothetical protein
MNLNTLHKFENNTTVATILSAYYDVISKADLLDAIQDESAGMLDYWAECNKMNESDLFNWIDCSLNEVAKFKVVNENGMSGGWPDCELDLGGGVILNLAWSMD